MPKYCIYVGFILAVFVTVTTTLPVKGRYHDLEDFRHLVDDADPGVARQIAKNPSGKITGPVIPTIWEEEVMKFTDPNGNKPQLIPTSFRVPTPHTGTKTPDPSGTGQDKDTHKETPFPGTGRVSFVATPSHTPCDLFYNGTYLVCRTPSTSPTPCARYFNGTVWDCQTSAPRTLSPTIGCYKASNGTVICRRVQTDKPCVGGCKNESNLQSPTPSCNLAFIGGSWICEPSPTPCHYSFNGTTWACHTVAPKNMTYHTNSHPAENTPTHARKSADEHPGSNKHNPVNHPEPSKFPRPTNEYRHPYGPTHPPSRPSTYHSPPMAPVDPFSQLMKQMACFPANSMVQMENGAAKRMSEVEVGDRVLTSCCTYSTVFAFSHRDSTIVSHFFRLDTASGHSLQLSPGHYISINGVISAAGTARVGDTLVLGNGATTTITRYSMVQNIGLFNPQTLDGNVVVDGVVATTFTVAVKPTAARALLAPLAWVYRMLGIDMIGGTLVFGGHNVIAAASKMFPQ